MKIYFNHVEHEKKHVEHLAQNYGMMVQFGFSRTDSKTIEVDKGDVVITEDLFGSNSVVLKESCTGIWYSIKVNMIMNIRIFTT